MCVWGGLLLEAVRRDYYWLLGGGVRFILDDQSLARMFVVYLTCITSQELMIQGPLFPTHLH